MPTPPATVNAPLSVLVEGVLILTATLPLNEPVEALTNPPTTFAALVAYAAEPTWIDAVVTQVAEVPLLCKIVVGAPIPINFVLPIAS